MGDRGKALLLLWKLKSIKTYHTFFSFHVGIKAIVRQLFTFSFDCHEITRITFLAFISLNYVTILNLLLAESFWVGQVPNFTDRASFIKQSLTIFIHTISITKIIIGLAEVTYPCGRIVCRTVRRNVKTAWVYQDIVFRTFGALQCIERIYCLAVWNSRKNSQLTSWRIIIQYS